MPVASIGWTATCGGEARSPGTGPRRELTGPDGFQATFEMDASRRQKLLEGLDDIAETLKHEDAICRYESKHILPSI